MRKLTRAGTTIPAILLSPDVRSAKNEIEKILRLPDETRLQRRIPINENIINAREVRETLWLNADKKCSYCESRLSALEELVVHHFRPVMNATNKISDSSDVHHYAWFAYDWRNLYTSCAECQRAAGSLFPVKGPRAPFFSSIDEARELERTRIVDPYFEDPQKWLQFQWNGYCISRSDRGNTTLSVFDLNRDKLRKARAVEFRSFLQSIEEFGSRGTDRRSGISAHLSSDSEFLGAKESLLIRFVDELREEGGLYRSFNRREPINSFGELIEDAGDAEFQKVLKKSFTEHESSDPSVIAQRAALPVGFAIEQDLKYSAGGEIDRTISSLIQLKSIEIQSFKGIGRLAIPLIERRPSHSGVPCLMLIGENATGKSSILEAIALACNGPDVADKLVDRPSDLIRRKDSAAWGLIDAEPASLAVAYFGSDESSKLVVDQQGTGFSGREGEAPLVLGYGPRRFFSRGKSVRSKTAYARVRTLFEPLATIPYPSNWLRSLDDSKFSAVARALREVLTLHPDDDIVRDNKLGVSVRINGQLTPLERMSEGYKSLFAMVVDVARELLACWPNLEIAKAILLIDEIETHLHPRWKMKVVSSLRRAFPNVTIVATTHDPLCLHGLDDGEVLVLQKDLNQEVELVPNLPSIKGLRADQLLTSEYFGLSSTVEPEIEASIVSYVSQVSTPASEKSIEADRLRRELKQLTFGNTATEQVIEEALGQFLEARRGSPVVERSAARDRAVRIVLEALKAGPERK